MFCRPHTACVPHTRLAGALLARAEGRSSRQSRRAAAMSSTAKAAAPAAPVPAATASPAGGSQPQLRVGVWDVGGEPTEVLELPASTEHPPEFQLLVVPGNPGAAPFYEPFMHALHHQLGGRGAVTCVSNLGMDGQGLTPWGRVFSLEEQIEHKTALLRERYAGPGRPPLVLLGHSIGTYMAVHALHRVERHHMGSSRAAAQAMDAVAGREWEHPDAAGASLEGTRAELEAELASAELASGQQQGAAEGSGSSGGSSSAGERGGAAPAGPAAAGGSGGEGGDAPSSPAAAPSNVVKVIGLYPFLQVDPECSKQRRLQSITPYHTLLARLAGGLGILPMGLRRLLVRTFSSGMDAHGVDTAARVFSTPSCVQNGLYMGQTEFEALAAPADWWLLQSLGRRFAMFAAPGDVWFKRWKWDAMHREVPEVEAHWVESQSHAFCVSERQSEELAARCARIVEAALATAKL